jgi:hypothetical protein
LKIGLPLSGKALPMSDAWRPYQLQRHSVLANQKAHFPPVSHGKSQIVEAFPWLFKLPCSFFSGRPHEYRAMRTFGFA